MTISNYGQLKIKLSRYMFQQRFAPDYDDATTLFENAANRRLRVLPMEASTALTTVAGEVALPTDYLAWRTVLWNGRLPSGELDYVHPAYLTSTNIARDSGDPSIFTIEGSTFKTRPMSDIVDGFEFHYYQKIPTITGNDNNTNWLLAAYSDAYLYGVLTQLFAQSRNGEASQLYKAWRDEVLAEIIRLSALTTGATSPKVRTAEYF